MNDLNAAANRPVGDLARYLKGARSTWLFFDYDGTLADFALTPADISPDPDLIKLINDLARQSGVRITVISGRRLDQIRTLLPVPGIYLAGTYGIELQLPTGEIVHRVDIDPIRPTLQAIKLKMLAIIDQRKGFFVEDKGWSLALHARYADQNEADVVIGEVRRLAQQNVSPVTFRLLGGDRFFEIAPVLANKGRTVEYLLEHFPRPGARLVYFGDDDKDEAAFVIIQAKGGMAVLVAHQARTSHANVRLASPRALRSWLSDYRDDLLAQIESDHK